ncbi:MAG: hypothetical protein AAGE43_07465 [Pseudomonadota bacterium]
MHQGRLYVAGGIAARLGVPYFTDASFVFDPQADEWFELPDLPEARHHAALVSTGERLFMVGGFNGSYTSVWRMVDTVHVLTETGWENAGTLPQAQAEGVLACHSSGVIHLATGQSPKGSANGERSDHHEVADHWRWDGVGAWETAAPIPTPRNSATGGWLGDELIVAGGRTAVGNLAVTEIYDFREDRWRTAAPLPLPQAGTASVVVEDGIIVFGGEIFTPEASVFPNVWRYVAREDRWVPLPDMLTPRHGIGAGLIGDRAYVIGGATAPGGNGTSNLNEVLKINLSVPTS